MGLGKFLEPAFIYSQALKAMKAPEKLHRCAGSTELSPLFFYVIKTQNSQTGSFTHVFAHIQRSIRKFHQDHSMCFGLILK